jgi:AcrR family transcriptional regulator
LTNQIAALRLANIGFEIQLALKYMKEKMASNPMRDEIIDAARQCYLTQGVSNTGMRDIANHTGIARSTLYRYFPNRDDLLIATIELEMNTLNDKIQKKLAVHKDPADVIVEGMLLALKEIPKRPLLKAVLVSDDDAKARRVVWRSKNVVLFGENLMQQVIQAATDSSELQSTVKPEIMVEWVYRILISYLTLPSKLLKSEKHLRTTLHALLIPVLLRQ